VSPGETHRRQHELFNNRDFDGFDAHMREDMTYEVVPQGRMVNGLADFKAFLREWTSAMPDIRMEDASYLEGPGFSLARVRAQGRNDGGPFGPLPATGREVDLPAWELQHYDAEGKLLSAKVLFDQVTLLTQLGHLQLPVPA